MSPHYVPALRFRSLNRFYDPLISLTTREQLLRSRLTAQLAPAATDTILEPGCGSETLAPNLR